MSDCPKIPRDAQIYSLDSLWWGVSLGGHHYTGHVNWSEKRRAKDGSSYKRHELERRLTLREAKELWSEQREPGQTEQYWKMGLARETNRFETKADLERAAVKWVTHHCRYPNWLLIDNDWINPRRPISAQGWYKDRVPMMAELAARWDKVPNYQRLVNGHEPTEIWNSVYRLWYLLLTPGDDITAEVVKQAGVLSEGATK